MDVVKTESGYISGTVLGEPDKPVYVFRGIPYATPPTGPLRWKEPAPLWHRHDVHYPCIGRSCLALACSSCD
jgi:carboxylesterase type B